MTGSERTAAQVPLPPLATFAGPGSTAGAGASLATLPFQLAAALASSDLTIVLVAMS